MRRWLTCAGIVAVMLTKILWGSLEALSVALLLATFVELRRRVRPAWMKVGLLSFWLCAFVTAGAVAEVTLGEPTLMRRTVVLRLYDFNCSAPFPTYRYPRDVVWLAEGSYHTKGWRPVLVCEPWIK